MCFRLRTGTASTFAMNPARNTELLMCRGSRNDGDRCVFCWTHKSEMSAANFPQLIQAKTPGTMSNMNVLSKMSVIASLFAISIAAPTTSAPTVDLGYAKYFGHSNATLG